MFSHYIIVQASPFILHILVCQIYNYIVKILCILVQQQQPYALIVPTYNNTTFETN